MIVDYLLILGLLREKSNEIEPEEIKASPLIQLKATQADTPVKTKIDVIHVVSESLKQNAVILPPQVSYDTGTEEEKKTEMDDVKPVDVDFRPQVSMSIGISKIVEESTVSNEVVDEHPIMDEDLVAQDVNCCANTQKKNDIVDVFNDELPPPPPEMLAATMIDSPVPKTNGNISINNSSKRRTTVGSISIEGEGRRRMHNLVSRPEIDHPKITDVSTLAANKYIVANGENSAMPTNNSEKTEQVTINNHVPITRRSSLPDTSSKLPVVSPVQPGLPKKPMSGLYAKLKVKTAAKNKMPINTSASGTKSAGQHSSTNLRPQIDKTVTPSVKKPVSLGDVPPKSSKEPVAVGSIISEPIKKVRKEHLKISDPITVRKEPVRCSEPITNMKVSEEIINMHEESVECIKPSQNDVKSTNESIQISNMHPTIDTNANTTIEPPENGDHTKDDNIPRKISETINLEPVLIGGLSSEINEHIPSKNTDVPVAINKIDPTLNSKEHIVNSDVVPPVHRTAYMNSELNEVKSKGYQRISFNNSTDLKEGEPNKTTSLENGTDLDTIERSPSNSLKTIHGVDCDVKSNCIIDIPQTDKCIDPILPQTDKCIDPILQEPAEVCKNENVIKTADNVNDTVALPNNKNEETITMEATVDNKNDNTATISASLIKDESSKSSIEVITTPDYIQDVSFSQRIETIPSDKSDEHKIKNNKKTKIDLDAAPPFLKTEIITNGNHNTDATPKHEHSITKEACTSKEKINVNGATSSNVNGIVTNIDENLCTQTKYVAFANEVDDNTGLPQNKQFTNEIASVPKSTNSAAPLKKSVKNPPPTTKPKPSYKSNLVDFAEASQVTTNNNHSASIEPPGSATFESPKDRMMRNIQERGTPYGDVSQVDRSSNFLPSQQVNNAMKSSANENSSVKTNGVPAQLSTEPLRRLSLKKGSSIEVLDKTNPLFEDVRGTTSKDQNKPDVKPKPKPKPKPTTNNNTNVNENKSTTYMRNVSEEPGVRRTTNMKTVGLLNIGFARDSGRDTSRTVDTSKRSSITKKEPPKTLPKTKIYRSASTDSTGSNDSNIRTSEFPGVSKLSSLQNSIDVDLRSTCVRNENPR